MPVKISQILDAALFEQPSSVYNQSLALVAIALCSDKFTQDMQALGFVDFKMYTPVGKEIPRFAIGQQSLRLNGEDVALIAILLQGTGNTAAQWLNDFKIWKKHYCGQLVHSGFKAYTDEVWRALNTFLDERPQLPAKKKLFIAGHSAGGAGANLLALRLQYERQHIAYREDIYAYCFATPNTCYNQYTNVAELDNIFNIINTEDIVPKIPFTKNWRKLGHILCFASENTYDVHGLDAYTQGILHAEFTTQAPGLTASWFFKWMKSFWGLIGGK